MSGQTGRSSGRAVALALALALAGAGCVGEVRESTTPRTAEEELLVSTAAERAVGAVDVARLAGRPVFVDVSRVEAVDRAYVVSAFRELCARAGARLVEERANAEVAIEVRSAALGANDAHWTLRPPVFFVFDAIGVREAPEFIEVGYVLHEAWSRVQFFAYERRSGAFLFGWRDGWGTAWVALTENIYPARTIRETLRERLE